LFACMCIKHNSEGVGCEHVLQASNMRLLCLGRNC